MPLIYLSQGLVAIVDDEDVALVERYKWCAHEHGHPGKPCYEAITNLGGGRQLRMHRLIMDAPAGMVVDHINGDQLDNRRANLRVCTYRQNQHNRHHVKLSHFPGVSLNRQRSRWRAFIRLDGKKTYLGSFLTEEQAAAAYRNAAGEVL